MTLKEAVYKVMLWTNKHSAEEIAEAIRPSFSTDKNLGNIIKGILENDIYSNTGGFLETGFNAINKVAEEAVLIKKYLKKGTGNR